MALNILINMWWNIRFFGLFFSLLIRIDTVFQMSHMPYTVFWDAFAVVNLLLSKLIHEDDPDTNK